MPEEPQRDDGGGVATAQDSLTVTDNRTGQTYEVEITDGTVRAMDFRQMKRSASCLPLRGPVSWPAACAGSRGCDARRAEPSLRAKSGVRGLREESEWRRSGHSGTTAVG